MCGAVCAAVEMARNRDKWRKFVDDGDDDVTRCEVLKLHYFITKQTVLSCHIPWQTAKCDMQKSHHPLEFQEWHRCHAFYHSVLKVKCKPNSKIIFSV